MVKRCKGGKLARRRGNVFRKIGIIVIIIMVGMCIMGVAHGAWKSTVKISATMETGDWGIGLIVTDSSSGIGTTVVSVDDLTVQLNIELFEVPEGSYYVDFTVGNTGSIPIKIQSITPSVSPEDGQITIDSITGVSVGLQLEGSGTPGDEQAGTVNFTVTPDDTDVTGTITITFTAIQWNQYS